MSRSNSGISSKVGSILARPLAFPSSQNTLGRFTRANVSSILSHRNASALALFSLFILCISGVARADDAIGSEIGDAAGGPAMITYCSAGSYGIPNVLVFQADFGNATPSPLTAVKLRFDLYDAFGTYLAGLETTRTGTFANGAVIQTSGRNSDGSPIGWRIRNQWPETRKVECSVAKTLAADGTVWANASLPSPPPSPAP